MSDNLEDLAGDWALTGLGFLAAGTWMFLRVGRILLRPLGVLVAADAILAIRLAQRLAAGDNDPLKRRKMARVLTRDALLLAAVAAAIVLHAA